MFRITQNKATGQHTLNRVITVWGSLILSAGFIKEAWSRSLTPYDYVAYAVALVILYAPPFGIKLIEAWKGIRNKESDDRSFEQDADRTAVAANQAADRTAVAANQAADRAVAVVVTDQGATAATTTTTTTTLAP
jgi:hypothetical protein